MIAFLIVFLRLAVERTDCTTQWQLALLFPASYPSCGEVATVVYVSVDRGDVVRELERIRANGWEWNYQSPIHDGNEGGMLARGWRLTEWCCPGWPEPCWPKIARGAP